MLGIDFGTTNSSIAIMTEIDSEPRSIKVSTGNEPFDAVMRSLVLTTNINHHVIGIDAYDAYAQLVQQKGDSRPPFKSFKPKLNIQRLKQKRYIRKLISKTGHNFAEDGPLSKTVWKEEELYSETSISRPELVEITSLVIRELIERAKENEGEDIINNEQSLYVGMPLNYNSYAKRRIVHALASAGVTSNVKEVFTNITFMYEPVAIASLYSDYFDNTDPMNILIFDFGGGTLDLALLRYTPNESTGKMSPEKELSLGCYTPAGERFDELLMEYVFTKYPAIRKIDDSLPEYEKIRYREFFERAKKDLSVQEEISYYYSSLKFEITRKEFEGLVDEYLFKMDNEALKVLLKNAKLEQDKLDAVIMSGGASIIPCVQNFIRNYFPNVKDINFIRPIPGDKRSEENALTGVSKGLAKWGYMQNLEKISPLDHKIWYDEEKKFLTVIPRGTALSDTSIELALQKPNLGIDIQVPANVERTVGIYNDLVKPDFIVAVRIPKTPQSQVVRLFIDISEDYLFPRIFVLKPSGELIKKYLVLDEMQDEELEAFIKTDAEVIPVSRDLPEWNVLIRPLMVGDYIEWSSGKGKVKKIWCSKNGWVDKMDDWDLSKYTIRVEPDEIDKLKYGSALPKSQEIKGYENRYLRFAPYMS